MSEILFSVYEVSQNTDLTEGRGRQWPQAYFIKEQDAKNLLDTLSGVMGSDSGKEIKKISYIRVDGTNKIELTRTDVWGWRRLPDGNSDYGWSDLRDIPEKDPEYLEYLRLQRKFRGA